LHFNNLLAVKVSPDANEDQRQNLANLWQDLSETAENHTMLQHAGFDEPETVLSLLRGLINDAATRSLSHDGRERLDRLIPLMLQIVGQSERSEAILHHIVELIRTIERRTSYLALLNENPIVLKHLVKLAEASPWILSFLSRHPVLLDELLDPRSLYAPLAKDEMERELREKLARVPTSDFERLIEEMCIFKQVQILKVAAADVTDVLPLMRVSDRLTDIAEVILAEVIELSWRHLVEKHGLPASALKGNPCGRGFTVIAYGKLGGLELGYDSDLDLVFLHAGVPGPHKDGAVSIDASQFYARLGQRVVHTLTAHTSAGYLYETDMRLRPSGSSGLLVSQVEGYAEYQSEKAWTWEHQALVRARVVYGNRQLAEYFDHIRRSVLSRERDPATLREDVSRMRERMREEQDHSGEGRFDLKQGAGGIVDIEFLVQYLVLLWAHRYPVLLRWTDNVRLLETLAETGCLDEVSANHLRDAYLTLRSVVHKNSLQEASAIEPEGRFRQQRGQVIALWQRYLKP
jgi:glutamate-ammonia-ligase adenylyltransferase